MTGNPADIAARFAVDSPVEACAPHGGGHINDSYRIICASGRSFLLQRLNNSVFQHPQRVMQNIERVVSHLTGRTPRVPALIPTCDGRNWLTEPGGAVWRMWRFIDGASSFECAATAGQAEQTAAAFGAFQSALVDLPGPPLYETIADFHDTPTRLLALEQAVKQNVAARSSRVREEIAFAMAHREAAATLANLHAAGCIPLRIVHNDAKISNVLFDAAGQPICIVDLDTVMPGLALSDFGDMVRSMSSRSREDDVSAASIEIDFGLLEGLFRGYLKSAGAFLTAVEREHLFTAGWTITLEQGVRFLTDFLNGDRYYKTQRPDHNLDRCHTQFSLLESLQRHRGKFQHMAEFLT